MRLPEEADAPLSVRMLSTILLNYLGYLIPHLQKCLSNDRIEVLSTSVCNDPEALEMIFAYSSSPILENVSFTISPPLAACVFIISYSSAVSLPGFCKIASGIAIFPTSCIGAAIVRSFIVSCQHTVTASSFSFSIRSTVSFTSSTSCTYTTFYIGFFHICLPPDRQRVKIDR